MRSRTSDWYIVKFRYAKTQEDGQQKNVTEQYVVDALSFTEAEANIIEAMKSYVSGDYKIVNIDPAQFHEIFFTDNGNDDKYFKAVLTFITIDEKTEKEKRSNVYYLVQAANIERARKNIVEVFGGTMIDYEIVTLTETKILGVFEHDLGSKGKVKADTDKTE